MSTMVKKAGSAILGSDHWISPTSDTIMDPIKINTGADASAGTLPKRGAKKRERKKSSAAVMAVSPVRPPSTIPAVHSTAIMMGLLPVQAEIMVPSAHAIRAHEPPGTGSSTLPMICAAHVLVGPFWG